MSLVSLLVVLVVLGFTAWAINRYMPMDAGIKRIAMWVLAAIAIFVVLSAFGVCDMLRGQTVPHV